MIFLLSGTAALCSHVLEHETEPFEARYDIEDETRAFFALRDVWP
jgi:hypothetical protein